MLRSQPPHVYQAFDEDKHERMAPQRGNRLLTYLATRHIHVSMDDSLCTTYCVLHASLFGHTSRRRPPLPWNLFLWRPQLTPEPRDGVSNSRSLRLARMTFPSTDTTSDYVHAMDRAPSPSSPEPADSHACEGADVAGGSSVRGGAGDGAGGGTAGGSTAGGGTDGGNRGDDSPSSVTHDGPGTWRAWVENEWPDTSESGSVSTTGPGGTTGMRDSPGTSSVTRDGPGTWRAWVDAELPDSPESVAASTTAP